MFEKCKDFSYLYTNIKIQVEKPWEKEASYWKPDCTETWKQMVLFVLLLRTMILLKACGVSKNDLMKYSSVCELLREPH